MPTRVAETSWQISTSKRIGLRKFAGFSTNRAKLPGAALLLVHQRLGLDAVHPHEAGLGHGQDARGGEQQGDDDDRMASSAWKPDAPSRINTLRPGD